MDSVENNSEDLSSFLNFDFGGSGGGCGGGSGGSSGSISSLKDTLSPLVVSELSLVCYCSLLSALNASCATLLVCRL